MQWGIPTVELLEARGLQAALVETIAKLEFAGRLHHVT
jgi:hypothetical protein